MLRVWRGYPNILDHEIDQMLWVQSLLENNFFRTLNTTQLNSKQLKVTKVEVKFISHMDFENGVYVKIYKS